MKKALAVILLIFTSGLFIFAPLYNVSAANPVEIVGTAQKFDSCISGGQLTGAFNNLINKGINDLAENLSKALAGKVQDSLTSAISSGINAALSLFTGTLFGAREVIVRNNDQTAKTIAQIAKEQYKSKAIARCTARHILSGITGNSVSISRTYGRDGGPTWITNWNNFQTRSQYRGENIFRAMLSNAQTCDYFKNDLKKAYGIKDGGKVSTAKQNTRTDSLQFFSTKIACTLPEDFSTEDYLKDFGGNGGWEAFNRLLEPQNNMYGAMLLSNDELSKQRQLAQSSDVNQALANKGYTGISGTNKSDSCSVKWTDGTCLIYKDIKTPGSYVAGSNEAALNAELEWITTAQDKNTIIANATEIILNRLKNLSNSVEGNSYVVDDANVYVPGTDDWGDAPPPPTPQPGGGGSGQDGSGGGSNNINGENSQNN